MAAPYVIAHGWVSHPTWVGPNEHLRHQTCARELVFAGPRALDGLSMCQINRIPITVPFSVFHLLNWQPQQVETDPSMGKVALATSKNC